METTIQLLSGFKSAQVSFNGRAICVTYASDSLCSSQTLLLDNAAIEYDVINSTTIEVDIAASIPSARVYYDKYDFLKRFRGESELDKPLVILYFEDSYINYDPITNSTSGFNSFFITNCLETTKTTKTLKESADYDNTSIAEMVFYTSAKGIFKLRYLSVIPELEFNIDYSQALIGFSEKLKDKSFQTFLKNEMADFVKQETNEPFISLLKNTQHIVDEAEKNLEIYLKDFSWDTFKSKLYIEKDKYFSSLRDILGKIMTQLVAVPISIAATTFATYKTSNSFVIILVGIAFTCYVAFVLYIQKMYYKDVKEIEADFNRDFQVIVTKSGLSPDIINAEKAKITRRIHSIISLIITFSIITAALGTLFNFYLASQLASSLIIKLLCSLIILAIASAIAAFSAQ